MTRKAVVAWFSAALEGSFALKVWDGTQCNTVSDGRVL